MARDHNDRVFKRHDLSKELAPTAEQHGGVAVNLYWPMVLDWYVCAAIMKDVGLGGAGLLIPADKKVPSRIILEVTSSVRLKGKIVYRRPVGERLVFLGVDWRKEPDNKRRRMLRVAGMLMQEKARAKRRQAQQEENLLE